MEYKELQAKIITLLEEKINDLNKNIKEKNILENRVYLITELLNYFKVNDFDSLYENMPTIEALIKSIFGNDISRNLIKSILSIKSYTDKDIKKYGQEIKRENSFINSFKTMLMNKLKDTKEELSKYNKLDIEHVISYKNILKSLKQNLPLTEQEFELLSDEIIEGNFDYDKQVIICQNIKVFNSEFAEEENAMPLGEMTDKTGFEYEKSNVSYVMTPSEKEETDLIVDKYYSLINEDNFLDTFKENTTIANNKFRYICSALLIRLKTTIFELTSFYSQKQSYLSKKECTDLLENINKYIKLYNDIKRYMLSSVLEQEGEKYQKLGKR